MNQEELFHEDIYNALWHVVSATGGSKRVASELRPDIPIDQASRWLANCLDRNRNEKLDLDAVVWLLKRGREQGVHAGMYYLADETNYERPEPSNPEDEMARLQREFNTRVKALEGIAKQIQKRQDVA